jgi:hypothetical protein
MKRLMTFFPWKSSFSSSHSLSLSRVQRVGLFVLTLRVTTLLRNEMNILGPFDVFMSNQFPFHRERFLFALVPPPLKQVTKSLSSAIRKRTQKGRKLARKLHGREREREYLNIIFCHLYIIPSSGSDGAVVACASREIQ